MARKMGKKVEISVVTRETIKPSPPTPEHQRFLKLSLLDQISFAMTTPLIIFYPATNPTSIKLKSQKLKSSLAKALSLFYPLAGKIKDNSVIECNDSGVDYIETRVDCSLRDLLHEPDNDVLERLIPIGDIVNSDLAEEEAAFIGAVIQVNFFGCGGLGIGVSISHKICDAYSLCTFLIAWANVACSTPASPHQVLPHFVSNTIIPSLTKNSIDWQPIMRPIGIVDTAKCETRRYVFDASKIALLKAKAASPTVPQPTRVEAVTSLIWKCLMNVSRSKSSGRGKKQSAIVQAINLRTRLVPPLTQNYIGNLSGKLIAAATNDRSRANSQYLVACLRKGLEETCERVANYGGHRSKEEVSAMFDFAREFASLHGRDDSDVYSFSSVCGIPLYEIDFGWGKPAWVIFTNLVLKNFGLLMNTRDGKGIELLISLSQEDVALLENDQEFLAFAAINPGVLSGHTSSPALQSCM